MDEPIATIDRVRQLEEALRESQAFALAGQFAAATMHEVNGPLEAISNLNYLVLANSDDGEQVRNCSGLIEEQLGSLTAISRQTLSFYHSQETMEPIRITPLAEAALRIHHKKIAVKEIRLLKKLPGGVIVEGNPGAMLQVFSNLIFNAVEALAPQGALHIRAGARKEKRISCSQTMGTGFQPRSGSGCLNYSSVRKKEAGRGWGWPSPRRLSSAMEAGSEAGQAHRLAEAERPSASRSPCGDRQMQPWEWNLHGVET